MIAAEREYRQAHIVAYKKWLRIGSDRITDAEVELIAEEDPAAGEHIRRGRDKSVTPTPANVGAVSGLVSH